MAEAPTHRRSQRIANRNNLSPNLWAPAASLLGGDAFEGNEDSLNANDIVESHEKGDKSTATRKRALKDEDDGYLPGGVVGYASEETKSRTLKRRARQNYEYSEQTTTKISKKTKFFKQPESSTSTAEPFPLKASGIGLTRTTPQAEAEAETVEPEAEGVEADGRSEKADDDEKEANAGQQDEQEDDEKKSEAPRKLAKAPEGGHLSKKYRVSFNWTPFPWHEHPTPEECQRVFDILTKWTFETSKYDINIELDRIANKPLHGSRGGTVHAVINVIMSQSTSNGNAISVQKHMAEKFPYMVNSEAVVTNIPNYHDVMKSSEAELNRIIGSAGLHQKRPRFILNFLKAVRQENERLLQVDGKLPDNIETGNPPNAPDFVPGLLSLDFLNGKTKEEIFLWLLSMDGIGVKSAICVLEFDFGYPLCAVDTHVYHLSHWLGWLPRECTNEDNAFCHLDARVPDKLKHALHQLFWQHMQLCVPCKRHGRTPFPAGTQPCPLEAVGIIRQHPEKTKTPYKPKKDEQGRVIKTTTIHKSVKITRFKNAEKAAANGYVKGFLNIHDDFDIDMTSTNIRKEERWEYVGVEEAMRVNGQSSVKTFFPTIKPE